ncbi:LacI family transcriptional regulator [Pseudolysobacter antarcticus]|uniref:LacI family transcriptional regulator n=1 Tax=Pseudolysobacter antarcticus TaxID=2511995 RepID=A0A411HGR9_9GAMM|nr:LacI family DNA-binding transcriptional regulator [Pseudolysobacter antarcticus]QBB69726.1 LacI family transcriptional regulator [Pseudolysobacter antarcticus]
MRARIEDVAATAGVSMKTVSRVFNHEPNVREKTRLRVEAAAQALNYRPNPSARSLAGNRSYLISLVYDDPFAGSAYVMEIIVGMLQACESTHYSAMLRPLEYSSAEHVVSVEDSVAQYRPDGLILLPPFADDIKLLQRLDELGVRYATISAKAKDARVGTILDERKAAAEMIAHAVSLGHRRIAHITGPMAHSGRAWRLAGYRDGLRRAGIDYDETLVVDGGFSFEDGIAGARQLLDLKLPPSAIFAANDDSACGVMHEAFERGLSIPQDLSVFGFDDTPTSRQVWPSLTTVRQPCRDMGRIAAEQLIASIRDPSAGQLVPVPYELQIRQSTGPVPTGTPAKRR